MGRSRDGLPRDGYLDGDTLAEKLTKHGPLPPPQALDAAIQIAERSPPRIARGSCTAI